MVSYHTNVVTVYILIDSKWQYKIIYMVAGIIHGNVQLVSMRTDQMPFTGIFSMLRIHVKKKKVTFLLQNRTRLSIERELPH